MSFLGSFKRALGFSSDDDNDDEYLTNSDEVEADADIQPANASDTAYSYVNLSDATKAVTTVITEARVAATATATPASESAAGADVTPVNILPAIGELSENQVQKLLSDESLIGDMFDDIIAVFNAALPDFVAKSIDADNQRKLLIESLSKNTRQRLAREFIITRTRVIKDFADEKAKIDAELKASKELNHKLDERQQEFTAARLSAERQKRALTERVHDLESQVTSLEAEKEQFELQTRSLLNRLRVAEVNARQSEAPAEIASAPDISAPAVATESPAASDELAQLKEKLQQTETELDQLRHENENLKASSIIAEKMISGLKAEIASLETQAQTKADEFATISLSKDHQIEVLTEESAKYQSLISELNENLRRNLYNYSLEEARLRRKIEKLSENSENSESSNLSEPSEPYTNSTPSLPKKRRKKSEPSATPRRRKKKSKDAPAIDAIDRTEQQESWFGTDDTPTEVSRPQNDDFGYKAPQRTETTFDENQLSLW